jgi:hypothetical protein
MILGVGNQVFYSFNFFKPSTVRLILASHGLNVGFEEKLKQSQVLEKSTQT